MKNKKYTQKKISLICRRRGIYLNNKLLKKNVILTTYIKNNATNINPMTNMVVGNRDVCGGGDLLTIGIIANKNKKLTLEQINTIKQDLNNPKFQSNLIGGGKISKNFDISIRMKPNKVITNKGILVRMGKGKGKIKTKAIYILKNMVCIELKQKNKNNKKIINFLNENNKNQDKNLINLLLYKFLKKYTFFSIITNIGGKNK